MLPGYNLRGFRRSDEGRGLPLRLDRDDLAHGRLDRDDLALGRSDGRRYLDFSLLELQLPLDLRPREEEVPEGGGPSYLRVSRRRGGFTSFRRVVSRNDGRGWFLFGFRARFDFVGDVFSKLLVKLSERRPRAASAARAAAADAHRHPHAVAALRDA